MGRRKAFTLLEILVALAILATAVVAVMGSIRHSLSMQRAGQRAAEAAFLARARLEALLSEPELREGNDAGSFDGHPSFRWKSRIERAELPLPEGPSDLLDVQLVVSWNDGHPREVRLSTLHRNRRRP